MASEYSIIFIKLDGNVHYTLWGEKDERDEARGSDRFLLNEQGRLLKFENLEATTEYAQQQKLKLREYDGITDVFELDLDKIIAWIRKPNTRIEPDLFNNTWNCAGDLAATVPTGFEKHDNNDTTLRIYNKLFAALNLPAVTPLGRHYIPQWHKWEVLLLRTVMRDAVAGFREVLAIERY